MRLSKLITAGILILTFLYVNSVQDKLLTQLVGVPGDELMTLIPPVAFDLTDLKYIPAAPAPPCPAPAKATDRLPISILKKLKLSRMIYSLFYPFTEKLTLSNPELPDCGSKAKTSIS